MAKRKAVTNDGPTGDDGRQRPRIFISYNHSVRARWVLDPARAAKYAYAVAIHEGVTLAAWEIKQASWRALERPDHGSQPASVGVRRRARAGGRVRSLRRAERPADPPAPADWNASLRRPEPDRVLAELDPGPEG